MMFCARECLCTAYPIESGEVMASILQNRMCQPYIESDTALSDEFIARNDGFWQAPEINFRYETKARKVTVDFRFDALYR